VDAAEPRCLASSGKENVGRSSKRTVNYAQEGMGRGEGMSQEQVAKEFGERRKNPAYRNGWGDGRFGPRQLFLENSNLAQWAAHQERLSYYRGHRDGQRVREMLAHGNSA
jgi:hypothetical protein